MLVRLAQFLNAYGSMSVADFGMFTDVRLAQFLNADSEISSIPSGRCTSFRLVMFRNAPVAIPLASSGMSTYSINGLIRSGTSMSNVLWVSDNFPIPLDFHCSIWSL